mmetsp:Transcript_95394/g.269733  ORF Transcript_95394/g.269733 Transcript_95394/m.269733 type:complete len:417 (-) Transcript_95394:885-2135(-)
MSFHVPQVLDLGPQLGGLALQRAETLFHSRTGRHRAIHETAELGLGVPLGARTLGLDELQHLAHFLDAHPEAPELQFEGGGLLFKPRSLVPKFRALALLNLPQNLRALPQLAMHAVQVRAVVDGAAGEGLAMAAELCYLGPKREALLVELADLFVMEYRSVSCGLLEGSSGSKRLLDTFRLGVGLSLPRLKLLVELAGPDHRGVPNVPETRHDRLRRGQLVCGGSQLATHAPHERMGSCEFLAKLHMPGGSLCLPLVQGSPGFREACLLPRPCCVEFQLGLLGLQFFRRASSARLLQFGLHRRLQLVATNEPGPLRPQLHQGGLKIRLYLVAASGVPFPLRDVPLELNSLLSHGCHLSTSGPRGTRGGLQRCELCTPRSEGCSAAVQLRSRRGRLHAVPAELRLGAPVPHVLLLED